MFNIAVPLIIFLFPLAYSPGPGNMFSSPLERARAPLPLSPQTPATMPPHG
jgi:hypothetical protein